jgi:hypothetical protein
MEDVTEGTELTEGQAGDGTQGIETTEAAPGGTEGQPTGQTTESGPDEQTFFDPKQVPDDLLPAYKHMQRAFSKKMEGFNAHKDKIEAYDAFTADPVGQMQRYAKQYGYELTRGEAKGAMEQNAPGENWEPQNWNEVLGKATEMASAKMMERFGPILQEVQSMKKGSIERELSEIDPTWQQYEGEMKELMSIHPTLANDASLLYKMAVPEEVAQSRATQAALAKLEAKGKSAQVSGGSSTNKTPPKGPNKSMTFDESVQFAKRQMAEEGITKAG